MAFTPQRFQREQEFQEDRFQEKTLGWRNENFKEIQTEAQRGTYSETPKFVELNAI